jgi:5-methylcytosine-specific restriction endonuclease McrA
VWCGPACRYRTRRALGEWVPAPKPPFLKLRYGTCEVCGQFWCGPAKGRTSPTCGREDCRSEVVKRRKRALYAANPTKDIERAARARAARNEEERAREAERLRVAKAAAGRTEAIRSAEARRRAWKAGARVERFTNGEVFERDGWVCGICSEPIDRSLARPDPMSVSLDHVVPLSKGGDHSRANCQAAHLGCNMRKRDRLDGNVA